MASKDRYKSPTHEGLLVNSDGIRRVKVELTATKKYWASPNGSLFKRSSGVPKGSPDNVAWKLDLDSIVEKKPHGKPQKV